MKHFVFTLLAAFFLISCGDLNSNKEEVVPKTVDYRIFTDEAEVKKVMDAVIAKVGDNMSKLDEIRIYLDRPSKQRALRADKPDFVNITLIHLNPGSPNTLVEHRNHSEVGEWITETKKVRLLTGDAETFVLADEMYDASGLTSDMVAKIVMEAWNKYKDEAKYKEQWVSDIQIKEGKITVRVTGILASNDLVKTEMYEKKL